MLYFNCLGTRIHTKYTSSQVRALLDTNSEYDESNEDPTYKLVSSPIADATEETGTIQERIQGR